MTDYGAMDRKSNRQPPSQMRTERSEPPQESTSEAPRVLARMPDVGISATADNEEPSENGRNTWLPDSSMSLPIYGAIGVALLTLAILPFLWGGSGPEATDVANEAPAWNGEASTANSSLDTGPSATGYPQPKTAPILAVSEPSNWESRGLTAKATSWEEPPNPSYQDTSQMGQDRSTANASWPNYSHQMAPADLGTEWNNHPDQIGQTENPDPRNSTMRDPRLPSVQADYRDTSMAMPRSQGELVNSTNYLSNVHENTSGVYLNPNINTTPEQGYSQPNYESSATNLPVYNDRATSLRVASRDGSSTTPSSDPVGYPDYRTAYSGSTNSLTVPTPNQPRLYSGSAASTPMPNQYEQPTAARFDGIIERPPIRTNYYPNR